MPALRPGQLAEAARGSGRCGAPQPCLDPSADSAFLADVLDFAMDRAFGRVERARLDGAWRQREGKEVDHEAARKVAMRVVARQSVGAGLRSFLKQ